MEVRGYQQRAADLIRMQTLGYIPGFFVSRIALSWADPHLVQIQIEASDKFVLERSRGSSVEDHVGVCVHKHVRCVSLSQEFKTAKEAAIIYVSRKNDDNICVSGLIHYEIFASLFNQADTKCQHDDCH